MSKTVAPWGKFSLRRIRLDRQGYTSDGRYYGIGAPLYQIRMYDGSADVIKAMDYKDGRCVRGSTRDAAKDAARKDIGEICAFDGVYHPIIRFFR